MAHNIFSLASLENKFQIVKDFQAEHYITSITEDGVNDAPTLKKTNINIDCNAWKMILVNSNFATMIAAV